MLVLLLAQATLNLVRSESDQKTTSFTVLSSVDQLPHHDALPHHRTWLKQPK
jgi:hypothetical protein